MYMKQIIVDLNHKLNVHAEIRRHPAIFHLETIHYLSKQFQKNTSHNINDKLRSCLNMYYNIRGAHVGFGLVTTAL